MNSPVLTFFQLDTLLNNNPQSSAQFKFKPVSPLSPFLTIAYLRAFRILEAACNLNIFTMQSIHIARQALHLVILLNDSVDRVEGPTEEQEDERINLER